MSETTVDIGALPFERIREQVLPLDRSGAEVVLLRDAAGSRDVFVIASALAAITRSIRLVVEVDTARTHPYVLARKLAALDKISGGRLLWSPYDAEPRRRAESVDLVRRLLLSWPPEAIVNDRTVGIHVNTDAVRSVRHDGEFYSVHSPLDVAPGPQREIPVARGAPS